MWQQPKTDWRENDFFNIQDYNRIKGNLIEIRSQALVLWPNFPFEELVLHPVKKEEMEKFIAEYIAFETAGWKELMNA